MQKYVHPVDLVKSFPTSIFLQILASIQKRTSPIKFNHLAEKSDKDSTSNLFNQAPDDAGAPVGVAVCVEVAGPRLTPNETPQRRAVLRDSALLCAVALGALRLEQLCTPLNVSWWYVDIGLGAEHGHQR